MELFRPKSLPGRSKRHQIKLRPNRNSDDAIARGFKIWIGAYAILMAAGMVVATGPVKSATPVAQATEKVNPAGSPMLVRANDMQSGGFLFKTREPGLYIEAPKVATDIKLDVTGPVARAIVTQRFLNPSDAWLEGIYVFPLPDNAAVDQLKMKIGDRLIEGKIKPKQEARDIYETAKREGKKASLLEQNRPNLFTNSVANIGPNEAITIQIEYQQTVPRKGEEFSLRVPLVVAPRYNPGAKPLQPMIEVTPNQSGGNSGWGTTDPVPDREEITAPVLDPDKQEKANPVTLSVNLKAGFPLDNVVSHYHDVTVKPEGEERITLHLKGEAVPADKDFLLTWTGKPGKTPNLGLFRQLIATEATDGGDPRAEDYLLAYITPPYKLTESLQMPPREVIFVIDQSGSMAGPSIRQAQNSLIEALGQLKPEDKFQIIRFNNHMRSLFSSPRQANKDNIATARYWVAAISAEGGTEMLPAMISALNDQTPDADTLRQVIFLTDGAIGNERQLFEAVKSKRGRSRIFTVGIGSAPNSFFMSRAAEVGRGTFTHIGDISEVKQKMGKLFNQLTSPVATDLDLTVTNGTQVETSPSNLPDLYLGEPVILAIKAKELGDKLTLTGRFDNQPWTMSLDLSSAAPSKAIGKLWARSKIRQWENERLLSNDPSKADQAIEHLGLKHHLVTRLTSLVAVDVTPSRPEGEDIDSTKVPLNLPDGWEMDKVFGEMAEDAADIPVMAPAPQAGQRQASSRNALMRKQFASQATSMLATKSAPVTGRAKIATAPTGQHQILLPRTSTRANLLILLGIMSLAIAGALMAWIQWRKATPAGS